MFRLHQTAPDCARLEDMREGRQNTPATMATEGGIMITERGIPEGRGSLRLRPKHCSTGMRSEDLKWLKFALPVHAR